MFKISAETWEESGVNMMIIKNEKNKLEMKVFIIKKYCETRTRKI